MTPPSQPIVLAVPTEPSPQTGAELYLDLLKKVLTRAIVARGAERHTLRPGGRKSNLLHRFNTGVGLRYGLEVVRVRPSGPENYLESGHETHDRVEDAETMLGTRQFDCMQRCIEDVLRKGVPGDLLEAGVWRGGMTIFMRAALKAHQVADRKVWVVDSFAGLPPINRQVDPDELWNQGDMAVPLEVVQQNFARYGLLDDQVVFLKGFFSDTLPTAPIDRLAILRVDADLYESTRDVLTNLYARLSPGGYAVFDDYHNLPDCRRAIEDFRREQGIADPIVTIDQRAVYWQKT